MTAHAAQRAVSPGEGWVLAADTAMSHASVALACLEGGRIVQCAQRQSFQPKGHGPGILDDVHALLGQEGLRLAQVSAYVTGLGPGSFTGLRIALSTLKGFALALDRPLYGVRTSDALRLNAPQNLSPRACVYGLIDARRDEVYAEGPGLERAQLLGVEAFAQRALAHCGEGEIVLLGTGALAYAAQWQRLFGARWLADLPEERHQIQARALIERVDFSQPPPALATLEPAYVRRSDAEQLHPEGILDALGRRQG